MKNNKIFNGLKTFFSIIGLLVFLGIPFAMITNVYGIGSMLSVIELVKVESLYELSSSKMVEGAAAGIVEALHDPYSEYLGKSEWEKFSSLVEGEFGGIGIYLVETKEGKLSIVSQIKDTPAARAGLKSGDIIIRIDDKSTVHMNSDKAVRLLRGEQGTKVELNVYRPADGQEYSFKIVREIINVPTVEDRVLAEDSSIGYIKLHQFSSRSSKEMADSLNRLDKEEIKGLILDLRDNGGGDFEVALDIADKFLDDKKIVSLKDGRGRETVERAEEGSYKVPMVVLVNGNSASASEVLSGALHDNERALLVGEKTFGKGVVQTVYPLRNGGALKLTTQQYFTPKGTDINKIGIKPDYLVKNAETEGKDPQLQKAIELLQR